MTANWLRTSLELVVAPDALRLVPVDGAPDLVLLVGEDGAPHAWPVTAAIDDTSILLHAHLPVVIAEEQLGAVGELVHRINWGLIEGAFELDIDELTVRVRAGAEAVVEGDEDRRIAQLLDLLSDLVASYASALADVLEDGVSPALALARAESDMVDVDPLNDLDLDLDLGGLERDDPDLRVDDDDGQGRR